jgi:trk system potassium uptake protein TrkA
MSETTPNERILIVGAGRVGRRAAAQLSRNGYLVTVIERDEGRYEEFPDHQANQVIHGDGTDLDVFQRANPTMVDVVAGLTDDTTTNLAVCELAREIVPEADTLARVNEDGEEEYAHLGFVDNIVYPAAAGARVTADRIASNDATFASYL